MHQVSVDTVKSAYKRNVEFFSDTDTWLLEGEELQSVISLGLLKTNQGGGIRVFSEIGYYLLVKPMRDKTSWSVQRQMADVYFKVTHAIAMPQIAPLTPNERLAMIKESYYFLEEVGLTDDLSRMLTRETVQNIILEAGGAQKQLPERAASSCFMIEDLRDEFKDIPDKQWFGIRGTFGRVVSISIQAADPDAKPYKITKIVNGSAREVNAWDNDYRDIAIAAIRSYINKHVQ